MKSRLFPLMMTRLSHIFSLEDLSTYRSELMGWSILWIMMLHFRFITLTPLGFVAQYGFAGVDIFMFVSGLGLYYSLSKSQELIPFYKKRLKRIFPVYYFIGIFASILLFDDNLATYLFRYTTIGYWIGAPFFEWYIPSLMLCYLLAPIAFRMINGWQRYLLSALIMAIVVLSFFAAEHQFFSPRDHFFTLYRIPAFLSGMFTGYLLKQKASARFYLVWLLAGIPLFAYFFPRHHVIYEFKYYSLFFMLPTFMLVFCLLSKLLKRTSVLIRQMGDASLEIYLIQTLFFTAIIHEFILIPPVWHDAVTCLLILGCSVTGILLHRMINYLFSVLHL